MERRRVVFIGFLVCILALTTLLAGSPAPSGSISVGDFAVLVASKMNPDDNQAMTPAAAADYLRKHGLKISSDLASSLTEKDAADLFAQMGIALQAERPDAVLTSERANALVGIFGSNLSSAAGKTETSLASKSTPGTLASATVETTPADCQALPRPPAPCVGPQSVCNPCMDCCKNQLGLTGKTCGHLCQKKNLVTSPSEPTP